jgi:membrane protein YdbS with pleckstrin-like domain
VDIVTGDRFSYGVNLASLWSISAIAIYGLLAVVVLFIMFVALKFIRRRYEM